MNDTDLNKAIEIAKKERTIDELALGWLRYEALRVLKPSKFQSLHVRNIAGENFDNMITQLVKP